MFVLLAGTSAGLMAARKTPTDLARFLFTRGLWLIVVEWFVISTAATFAPGGIAQLGGQILVTMQVIWAIGASMVVLAARSCWADEPALLIGAAIVAGHNLLDPIWPTTRAARSNSGRCGRRCTRRCRSAWDRSCSCSCIRCCRGSA